ncbi:1,4-alpha-glucan branching protein GlgB [Pedobacter cryophilus]|uniref:1,4-alpha-glucan branching enzyme GlgB n=1 Tax=Pedobacter cryophilus TaxID=2571271 RepID=A0A4U1BZB5_9SPHI|nr:1,4-alpha-glucan branching protein GlgB [Pedobacter cryophilus]TKB97033.1 1,4-alpha-glucan branching protein GlgB [Pedobacter cryophilus]
MAKKIKEPEPESSVKEKKVAVKKVAVKKTVTKKKETEVPQIVANKIYPSVLLYSRFSEFDISLFKAGKHYKLHEKFGAHVINHEGVIGTYFAVWAPNAHYVSVIGNFNYWDKGTHELFVRWDHSGIWEGFIPHVGNGEAYKYFIESNTGEKLEKADPFALRSEEPPRTASIVWDTWYEWKDSPWMEKRHLKNALNKPMSVYEVHFGSWARGLESPDQFLSYRDMAHKLVPYVKEMGFTHVEFMPLMEHPFYPSWGYQITGFFAATCRFGTPQDLMYLIEQFHENGIGVLLDWVPSHFPGDAHGLYNFDGSHLYEHADMRKGFHPDWKSYIFNYGRNEVKAFLISNAIFWLERFHIDGLRVDAVASMLYLDYSREEGEWVPNDFGGRENLEAIAFLKEFNEAVYVNFPDVQTIAEESTSFSGVSHPTYTGGLGFGQKWMMGWMNDTLRYFQKDPIYRKNHHSEVTFSTIYAFTENFMLPLSHDEVVHGKKSLIYKMPGDEWQQFANLRLLYSYMWTHPGTKLLFMGSEFAQTKEWDPQHSLDWHLLEYAPHQGIKKTVMALNKLYKEEPAMYERSFDGNGFEWIVNDDADNSVLVYARKGLNPKDDLIIALNLTPVPRLNYRFGVTRSGNWKEIFNSDELQYWGSGMKNNDQESEAKGSHWKANSIEVNVPPLGMVVFKAV